MKRHTRHGGRVIYESDVEQAVAESLTAPAWIGVNIAGRTVAGTRGTPDGYEIYFEDGTVLQITGQFSLEFGTAFAFGSPTAPGPPAADGAVPDVGADYTASPEDVEEVG